MMLPSVYAATIPIPGTYTSIQQGIDSSSNGDTVLVYPGVYFENINFHGKQILVGSLYLTTQDTSYISSTVITSSLVPGANKSIVTFENAETPSAQLIGLTLTGGAGNWRLLGLDPFSYGGGIYCNNASPVLSHLRITENTADCGGGLFLYNSGARIEYCTIAHNDVNSLGLEAPAAGGGMACWNSAQVICTHSRISGNIGLSGAGLYALTSTVTLYNCLVTENHALLLGAGFYGDSWSHYNIINCTVTRNRCDRGPGIDNSGVFYGLDSASVHIQNSIFRSNASPRIAFQSTYSENAISVAYSNLEYGNDSILTNGNATLLWLAGNISAYPGFTDSTSGDYHLTSSSPCINSGDTAGWSQLPSTDLDGNHRFVDDVDMGCYEFQGHIGLPSLPQTGLHGYPNPATDYIVFYMANSPQSLHYSILQTDGKLVRSGFLDAYTGEFRLCTDQLSDGIYLLQYSAAPVSGITKFIVAR